MENQHRKISGYRDLSEDEIALMNEIKALGPQLDAVVEKVIGHLVKQKLAATGDEANRFHLACPERWVAIARTDFQTGLMALTRAVAQPTFF